MNDLNRRGVGCDGRGGDSVSQVCSDAIAVVRRRRNRIRNIGCSYGTIDDAKGSTLTVDAACNCTMTCTHNKIL